VLQPVRVVALEQPQSSLTVFGQIHFAPGQFVMPFSPCTLLTYAASTHTAESIITASTVFLAEESISSRGSECYSAVTATATATSSSNTFSLVRFGAD
jgi:hypothetical protein